VASTYCSLHAHLIFATKGRAPIIETAWREDLHAYLGGIARGLGAKPVAIGGVEDHVHLLVGLRPTHNISDFVREVKKASSVWASGRQSAFAWQDGYAALSVSRADIDRLTAYISQQESHHKKVSSAEELRAILEEFGVEIDERFFD
jgi:putative transposase